MRARRETGRGSWLPVVLVAAAGLMLWGGASFEVVVAGCLFLFELWLCWCNASGAWDA